MNPDSRNRERLQTAWGIALVLAGLGVIYRIPQVMPKIKQIEQFAAASGFVYFCFYLMAVVLIIGGGKKIYTNVRALFKRQPPEKKS